MIQQLRDAYQSGSAQTLLEGPRTHVLWCDQEAISIRLMQQWQRRALPASSPLPGLVIRPLQQRKLRIAYLASDFREHPTARLLMGAIRHHDKQRLEVVLYCSGWDDGSPMRQSLLALADEVHSVAMLSDQEAAQRIRDDRIDVLIELNGPTRANRMGILSWRPAPVQISYLGWPGSVGGGSVDYIIGDDVTIPAGSQSLYPERVIRLPGVYQINDHASLPMPATPRPRISGTDGKLVLGMFNAINKVRGEVWQAWMQILKAVPNALLWVLDPGPTARANLLTATQAAGISSDRILLAKPMPQQAHLQRLRAADLMLDPWPYGGHTSTTDALHAGVPVLALRGGSFAARVSAALLLAAGLDELVANDPQDYVARAIGLLQHQSRLTKLQEDLPARLAGSLLLDSRRRTRHLESAYVAAFQRAAQGLPPSHLQIMSHASSPALAEIRMPLVLVVGPWSSGTSAVAGALARAGLQAPGPHVRINDPRTPETTEMLAFQQVLRELASEQTLTMQTSREEAFIRLKRFRDQHLSGMAQPAQPPLMLKHALAALFLPELANLFDLRVVGVLRPHVQIEQTRLRRGWHAGLGRQGAEGIYQALFGYLCESRTPFHLVRFQDLQEKPGQTLRELYGFCGLQPTSDQHDSAMAFVSRPARPEHLAT